MSNTILITGGAGYIGSHTIVELIKSGFQVISLDNYSNSTEETYARIEKVTQTAVANYSIDICDYNALEKIIEQHKNIVGIIHFAALKSVPESVDKPLLYYKNNINSLLNVLEVMEEFNIPNIIFSSSCSVYGNVKELPVNEETIKAETESPYAFTKLTGEKILEDFIKTNKTKRAISLRYFNPVGAHTSGLLGELPTNRPNNLVPIITQTAIGKIKQMTVYGDNWNTRDGTCIRDYIHVSDIADAHVKAIQLLLNNKNKQAYDIFNLGSGNGVTVLEAINAFEKVSGKKLNYTIGNKRAGDVEAIYSDSKKALTELNWKTQHSIEEMMETAWKWELNLASENIKPTLV